MNRIISSFLIGLLFGLGLVVSGMSNPAKIVSFLDIAGGWDPSLLVVMGAAFATTFVGYRLVTMRTKPLIEDAFQIPTKTVIDRPLLLGSAIFGMGWGLAGLCPGPGVVSLSVGGGAAIVYVAAMLAGMWARGLVKV